MPTNFGYLIRCLVKFGDFNWILIWLYKLFLQSFPTIMLIYRRGYSDDHNWGILINFLLIVSSMLQLTLLIFELLHIKTGDDRLPSIQRMNTSWNKSTRVNNRYNISFFFLKTNCVEGPNSLRYNLARAKVKQTKTCPILIFS